MLFVIHWYTSWLFQNRTISLTWIICNVHLLIKLELVTFRKPNLPLTCYNWQTLSQWNLIQYNQGQTPHTLTNCNHASRQIIFHHWFEINWFYLSSLWWEWMICMRCVLSSCLCNFSWWEWVILYTFDLLRPSARFIPENVIPSTLSAYMYIGANLFSSDKRWPDMDFKCWHNYTCVVCDFDWSFES
jgi:hypothetical protein